MNDRITYHQQVSYCGKPRCRRCREGIGHGPYWYAYQTLNGRTIRTYIGKQLPAEMQRVKEETRPSITENSSETLVRLYVLGQFHLERKSGQHWQAAKDAAIQHQRVRDLLSCLISSPGRKLGREQVIDMLWPELDFETATHRLDRAVHSLRQLFEPTRSRPATSSLLLTEHQTLLLADQAQIWIDADAFDSLLVQTRTTNDPGQAEQLLEEAMTLYGGDFLSDERHIPLIQTRREALQRKRISLLLELADLRIAREALPSAIDILDQLLSIDPANEAAVQRLIVLRAQSGRRGEAMRIYQRFATLLKQEYKLTPLPETRKLYEAVQRGEEPVMPPSKSVSLASTDPTTNTDARTAEIEQNQQNSPGQQDESEKPSYVHIGRSRQSPLVGRDQELAILHKLLLATEQTTRMKLLGQKKASAIAPTTLEMQRRPQCILLMGDVGIGKTRLAEEIGREAKGRGWAVAWSRVYAQENNIPYRLWTEVLRKAMSQGLWQRQELARRHLVRQSLSALLPELHDLIPEDGPPLTAPEQEQIRLWEAAQALLTTISENTPLLIVLDDLQWADGSSCQLLGYLVRQLRGHPILVVGTCRDIELPPNHPLRPVLIDLQREQAIETLTIQSLTNEQIRALVAHLPEPLVEHIQTRAAGNPFFAEELARGVAAQLTSSDQAGNNDVGAQFFVPSTATPALPDTISAVLDLRMGRLSTACQRLLVRAAVLGGSFEFHALRLMETSGSSTDEDTVLDLLEEALQAGMLTEEGSGTRITYHFWHPLFVSHLYDGLSAARRASLHRRAAEVLRQVYQGREEEGAAAIVNHLVKGGAEPTQIAHYAELAGDRAYALSAYPEAEKHYCLAMENIGTLPENASNEERLHLAYLLERLGECTMIQGNDEEARRLYEQVLQIRSQQRHFSSDAEYQHEAQIQALLWGEIGRTWYDTSDNAQAQQCFERGEQVLREAQVIAGSAWARLRFQQSYNFWQMGNFEKALKSARQALKLFEEVLQNRSVSNSSHSTHTRRTLEGDPVDLGRTHRLLAALAVDIGQLSDALGHLNTARAMFEQHDRKREIANVCSDVGYVHMMKAEYIPAQAAFRRSLKLAELIGEIPLMSLVFSNSGELAARTGDLVEAESWFKRCIALAEQVNDHIYVSLWSTALTIVLKDQGKLSEANASLRRALAIGRAMHIIPCTGLALLALGQLRIAQATIDEENSVRLLRRAQSTLQRALTLEGLEVEVRTDGQLTLAQVFLMLGELETARQLVASIMEEAHNSELKRLIARAQRLLGSILAAQGQQEQAYSYFEQAIQFFRDSELRLEYARALQAYGTALLQNEKAEETNHEQGLAYLQEARQAFQQCNAALDLQVLERSLSTYKIPPPVLVRKGRKER